MTTVLLVIGGALVLVGFAVIVAVTVQAKSGGSHVGRPDDMREPEPEPLICGLCGREIEGEPSEYWVDDRVTYLHHGATGTGASCFMLWSMGERPA